MIGPESDAEYAAYYELRWQVLREPWAQPRGSERDELEPIADHALIKSKDGRALAVGRLHFNSPDEAQIRYMAVDAQVRGQGLGRRVLDYLETIARRRGAAEIVLNARDEVVGFYANCGYQVVGKGPTMFGSVTHSRMRKRLLRQGISFNA